MVQVCSELEHNRWNDFVQSREDHSIYHLWGWKKVIEESFGHSTHYLVARDQGKILGIYPTVVMKSRLFGSFLISLPFLNYGGPLAISDDALEVLLKEAIRLAERENVEFIEVRRELPLFDNNWITKSHKISFHLDLVPDSDQIWENLKDKVRNQVRKAEKNQCVFAEGHHCLNLFYRVFSENMRDLGTPVYSKVFFENILREFPSESRIFVVEVNGKPLAAAFTLGYRGRFEIPWAASIYRYHRLNANMFLYWNLIKWACEQGYQLFDFGRSTQYSGPYRFKKQWGGKEKVLSWNYYLLKGLTAPELNPRNPKYRMAIAVWKRMPLWLTNRWGPRIVRNIP